MAVKLDTQTFIERAKAVHGDKYDYNFVVYNGLQTKITIICTIHGEFEQTPDSHLRGSGCRKCSYGKGKRKKVTPVKEVIDKCRSKHGNKYDYSKISYGTVHDTVIIGCPIHGEFEQKLIYHMREGECPKCSRIVFDGREDFIKEAKKVHGDKYDYKDVEYVNSSTKVNIICPKHGSFTKQPNSHIRGFGCQFCGKVSKHTTETFIIRANEIHDNKYDYSKVLFKDNKSKVTILCPEHGEFQQTPSCHLDGRGCQLCGNTRTGNINRLTHDNFISMAKEIHGETYDYSLVNYKTRMDKVAITCPIHGEFNQIANNHLQGSGCPTCFPIGSSKLENSLVDFIKTFYIGTVLTSDRTYIKPKELDIVLPNINLAIEFNGLYWHSFRTNKDKNYHLNKTNACRDAGLRLIHVFENEWVNTPEIVKSRLKQLIGAQINEIDAEDCTIKELSQVEAQDFFNQTHIKGYIKGEVVMGLINNNQIVSAMSFGKPRYNQDYDWELLQFSIELYTNVIDSASKLFKNFRYVYKPNSIVSYADLRWHDGSTHGALGFHYKHNTKPNYFYYDNDNRIFDCGNAVYAYHT